MGGEQSKPNWGESLAPRTATSSSTGTPVGQIDESAGGSQTERIYPRRPNWGESTAPDESTSSTHTDRNFPRRPNWGESSTPLQFNRVVRTRGQRSTPLQFTRVVRTGGQPRTYPRRPNWGESASPGLAPLQVSRARKSFHIKDHYKSLDEVVEALRLAGLESSNLILGIDFTKSNEWTGKHSFYGQSLHAIGDLPNPYEQAISIIGQTLCVFDEDNLIPCFGFGDSSTHDRTVFSFYQDHRPCQGFDETLSRYRQIAPRVKLAGPTSFAPIIHAGMKTVQDSGGQYHVLVIIADGQVTRSVETSSSGLSPQERATIEAIGTASHYPLSIILVGIGDGPWDMMSEFHDNIPARAFDNFQFVNFSEIMARPVVNTQREAMFALTALREIPRQFEATMELELLGQTHWHSTNVDPLPPPQTVLQADLDSRGLSHSNSSASNDPSVPPLESSRRDVGDDQLCPICFSERKDMAFGCGHQTCCRCGKELQSCPICRETISIRIRLY